MYRGTPEGIQLIENIHNQPGVDTLEGRIGPLLFGEKCQSHYIELPKRGYCEAHAHATESIIYTVRGQWVLCSGEGQRFHMLPGSLFWFGSNIKTGYEVPFDVPAYILIFKNRPGSDGPHELMEYLKTMAAGLQDESRKGVPFTFDQLPESHPACLFAAQLTGSIKRSK